MQEAWYYGYYVPLVLNLRRNLTTTMTAVMATTITKKLIMTSFSTDCSEEAETNNCIGKTLYFRHKLLNL